MKNILKLSQSLIKELFNQRPEMFLQHLSGESIWVTPGFPPICGRNQIQQMIEPNASIISGQIKSEKYYQVEGRNQESTVVAVQLELVHGAECIHSMVTLHFEKERGVWKIICTHISMEQAGNLCGGIQSGTKHIQFAVWSQGMIHLIDLEKVLYLEASNKKTVIYYADRSITVNYMLGQLEERVPGNFCRVHRGYLVNCNHIRSIARYMLELTDHTRIPIPEKKYTQVKKEILSRTVAENRK